MYKNEVPKPKAVTRSLQFITPEKAREILATSEKTGFMNRSLHIKAVNRYREDLEAGKWLECVDAPICFSEKGELYNGQHRLTALSQTKVKGVEFLVIENCTMEMLEVIDGESIPRSTAHKLKLFNNHPIKKDFTQAATILTFLGTLLYGAKMKKQFRFIRQLAIETGSTIADLFELMPVRTRKDKIFYKSGVATALTILLFVEGKIAIPFIESLFWGEGLTRDNPIYSLRENLMFNAGKATSRMPKEDYLKTLATYHQIKMNLSSLNISVDAEYKTLLIRKLKHNKELEL